mmetsp:Transcript_34226/g.102219  ORF Transcript_34226/g.102219 Transcript_34226/m.102219 type:complete len:237 (-) Transcript_34226:62-772(-)
MVPRQGAAPPPLPDRPHHGHLHPRGEGHVRDGGGRRREEDHEGRGGRGVPWSRRPQDRGGVVPLRTLPPPHWEEHLSRHGEAGGPGRRRAIQRGPGQGAAEAAGQRGRARDARGHRGGPRGAEAGGCGDIPGLVHQGPRRPGQVRRRGEELLRRGRAVHDLAGRHGGRAERPVRQPLRGLRREVRHPRAAGQGERPAAAGDLALPAACAGRRHGRAGRHLGAGRAQPPGGRRRLGG